MPFKHRSGTCNTWKAVKFVADNLKQMVREESVKILVSIVHGKSAGDADKDSVEKVSISAM